MDKTDTPAKVASTDELGHLPERVDLLQATWQGDREFMQPVGDYYSAEQMRAYASAAVVAERERCATAFEAEVETWENMRQAGLLGAIKRKGAKAIRGTADTSDPAVT